MRLRVLVLRETVIKIHKRTLVLTGVARGVAHGTDRGPIYPPMRRRLGLSGPGGICLMSGATSPRGGSISLARHICVDLFIFRSW